MSPPIQQESDDYDNNNNRYSNHQQNIVDDAEEMPELEDNVTGDFVWDSVRGGPNPAEYIDNDEQDQEEYSNEMPELDTFMENAEVNDNVLDFGYNFNFLAEMN